MQQHWLDIQSFFTDQRVLSAIDDLAIATRRIVERHQQTDISAILEEI